MASTNGDVVNAQMERLAPKLQEIFETTDGVAKMIKKAGPEYKVSTWSGGGFTDVNGNALGAFRIPLQRYVGGDYGTFNYDDGDLGTGTSMRVDMMTISYFPDRYAINISSLAQNATASSEQSVIDIVKYQTKASMKEFQHYYDTGIHGDGRGVLATANGTGTPTNTNPTYALEPNFGAQRLRLNQPVDIYDTTGVNYKGQLRVASYSLPNKTVTLTGTVTGAGAVNTDLICFTGMSPTLAVGSWRNGLYTYQNTATSGYTLGLSRSVVQELVTPSYNANSGTLTAAFPLALRDQMIQRRDEETYGTTRGICHFSQRAAWYLSQQGISNWPRSVSDKAIDVVQSNIKLDDSFDMAGVPHMISKKQDRSRVDWIVPKNWARVTLHDMKFHTTPDGKKFFEDRSSSNTGGTIGNVRAGFNFFLIGTDNIADCDPGAGGLINSLQVPTGY